LRVTRAHRDLLSAWDEILCSAEYLAAQGRVWTERPIWLLGDQEVLSGLLGSERFSRVPILWLRRGHDVAHCFPPVASGYAAHERIANILRRRTPTFVHSIVERPWRPPNGQTTLHLETSPYTLTAAQFEADVEEPLPWTRATLPVARLLRTLTAGGTNASELLPALGWELKDQRILKVFAKRLLGKAAPSAPAGARPARTHRRHGETELGRADLCCDHARVDPRRTQVTWEYVALRFTESPRRTLREQSLGDQPPTADEACNQTSRIVRSLTPNRSTEDPPLYPMS